MMGVPESIELPQFPEPEPIPQWNTEIEAGVNRLTFLTFA